MTGFSGRRAKSMRLEVEIAKALGTMMMMMMMWQDSSTLSRVNVRSLREREKQYRQIGNNMPCLHLPIHQRVQRIIH